MKTLDVLPIAALVLLTLPLPGLEGAEARPTPEEGAVTAEAGETAEPEPAAEEFEEIESILRAEEAMIQGAYTYDPGDRRDPFVSLVARTRVPTTVGGDCPTGCLIDQMELTGIFVMPEGPVAQMKASHEPKSILVRVGDEFHDGDVIAITADTVRFRQIVNNFEGPNPYREVFKTLSP